MKKSTPNAPDHTGIMKKVLDASPETLAKVEEVLDGTDQVPPSVMTGPLLMGISEGARYLGVSRTTLWRMIQSGRLTKVEIRKGSYRVRRLDLEAIAAAPVELPDAAAQKAE